MAAERALDRLREQSRATGTEVQNTATAVRKLGESLDETERRARPVGDAIGRLRERLGGLFRAAGGIGAVSRGFSYVFDEASKAAKASAQTVAVIRSTGGAANVTAGHVGLLADRISRYAGVDATAVRAGENVLLTFSRVRNEIGRGNKVFDRATISAADMSAALGIDMRAAASMLGKALDDPVKGYGELSKAGISFSDGQVAQIRRMQESGNLLRAQKLILGEVSRAFGGSAAAQAQPMEKLRATLQALAVTVGTVLLPFVDGAATAVVRFIDGLRRSGQLDRWMGTLRTVLTDVAVAIRDVFVPAGAAIVKFLSGLPKPVKIAIAALAGVLLLLGGGPGAIAVGLIAGVVLVRKHWGSISTFFSNLWRTLRSAGGKALSFLGRLFGLSGDDAKRSFKAIGNVAKAAFAVIRLAVRTLLPIVRFVFEHRILPIVRGVTSGMARAFRGTARLIGGIIKVLSGVLTGNWSKAWEGIKQTLSGAVGNILGTLEALTAPARAALTGIWEGLGTVAEKGFAAVKTVVIGVLDWIADRIDDATGALSTIKIDLPGFDPIGVDIPKVPRPWQSMAGSASGGSGGRSGRSGARPGTAAASHKRASARASRSGARARAAGTRAVESTTTSNINLAVNLDGQAIARTQHKTVARMQSFREAA